MIHLHQDEAKKFRVEYTGQDETIRKALADLFIIPVKKYFVMVLTDKDRMDLDIDEMIEVFRNYADMIRHFEQCANEKPVFHFHEVSLTTTEEKEKVKSFQQKTKAEKELAELKKQKEELEKKIKAATEDLKTTTKIKDHKPFEGSTDGHYRTFEENQEYNAYADKERRNGRIYLSFDDWKRGRSGRNYFNEFTGFGFGNAFKSASQWHQESIEQEEYAKYKSKEVANGRYPMFFVQWKAAKQEYENWVKGEVGTGRPHLSFEQWRMAKDAYADKSKGRKGNFVFNPNTNKFEQR